MCYGRLCTSCRHLNSNLIEILDCQFADSSHISFISWCSRSCSIDTVHCFR
ncbi:hypothetical protein Micbo1qcDRAFT_235681 [Microdochium bolleyi]|uniref:Uncharacterized protein n=1 Tax=Microdochium bolleyi TaxID=196109 RepID=A0A136IVC3_9PEZI|nr:hypothetical protein Micbo1qcDRAFT_235681 [Microdochium bolleyi]